MGLDQAGQLVTSGLYGWTLVVTGTGVLVEAAQHDTYTRIRRVFVPNGRYRLDIGDQLLAGDLRRLQNWGLFGA